jgi:hypothetical protein
VLPLWAERLVMAALWMVLALMVAVPVVLLLRITGILPNL